MWYPIAVGTARGVAMVARPLIARTAAAATVGRGLVTARATSSWLAGAKSLLTKIGSSKVGKATIWLGRQVLIQTAIWGAVDYVFSDKDESKISTPEKLGMLKALIFPDDVQSVIDNLYFKGTSADISNIAYILDSKAWRLHNDVPSGEWGCLSAIVYGASADYVRTVTPDSYKYSPSEALSIIASFISASEGEDYNEDELKEASSTLFSEGGEMLYRVYDLWAHILINFKEAV
jgi:hypothetical protein